jgi:hypothetical protein
MLDFALSSPIFPQPIYGLSTFECKLFPISDHFRAFSR